MIDLTIGNSNWSPDKTMQRTAFASDMGITCEFMHANGWPRHINDADNIGNGQPLIATTKKVVDGDLMYVRYNQQLGCMTVVVYND